MSKTINYNKTIIYKIYCKDENITDCYIGRTTNFKNRKNCHKYSCNNINSKLYNQKNYKFIRDNGGFNNWIIEIIEKTPCNNIKEAIEFEKLYYEKYNPALNILYPGQTRSESKKKYNKINKDKLNEYKRNYRKKNNEIMKKKDNKYYEKNKEVILLSGKKYRKKNKEILNIKHKKYYEKNCYKISCIYCKKMITKYNMKAHHKTKKCLKIQLDNINNDCRS